MATSLRDSLIDRLIDALNAGRGRLFAGGAGQRHGDRRARSPGRAAAGAGPARHGEYPGVGDLRARHHRRRFRARRRAGRADRARSERRALAAAVRAACRRGSASSSISTSPGRTASMEGASVYDARKRIGAELARESAGRRRCRDSRCRIPACRRRSAIAAEAGIPFELGIIRNHYVGRTFIEPTDHIRHLGVKLKHNANRAHDRGQAGRAGGRLHRARHHLEEDRRDGARRRRHRSAYAHLQPADDPFLLLRHRHARAEGSCWPPATTSRRWPSCIGVDSLAFISIDGLYRAMGEAGRNSRQPQFCDACFTGDYPTR